MQTQLKRKHKQANESHSFRAGFFPADESKSSVEAVRTLEKKNVLLVLLVCFLALLPVLVCGHLVELISLLIVSYLLSQVCLLKQYHPPEQHTHKLVNRLPTASVFCCCFLPLVLSHLPRTAATSCCPWTP